jgi:F-type H+-transporting ATPase subunit b
MLDKLKFTGIERWDLGVYTLIVFILLMVILAKYAWPHIRSGLEKREASIFGAMEQAKKDRAEAAELLARAKKELDETAVKIRAILDEARKDAVELKAAETEKGVKDAQAERDRAKREGEENKAALAKDLQRDVVELAVLIATKAVRQQMSIQNQTALLEESIAELKANASQA